jgi:hypothetical protein
MHALDAIEAINFEQLATATDRLLLRRGRLPKHALVVRRAAAVRARSEGAMSAPRSSAALAAAAGGPGPGDATLVIRGARSARAAGHWLWMASAAILAVAIAATISGVA